MTTFRTMLAAPILAALAILASPAAAPAQDSAAEEDFVYVTMKTNKGDILLELNRELAPVTVENFLSYVEKDFYEGVIVHRVVPGFVLQAGGYTEDLDQKPTDPPIKNEWRNGLTNDRGTISMARTNDPDSATSQFFINLVDNEALDVPRSGRQADPVTGAAYCVFGRVADGMDVVDAIAEVETTQNPKLPGMPVPVEPVVIQSVERVGGERLDTLMDEHESARQEILAQAKQHREKIQEQVKMVQQAQQKAMERQQALQQSAQQHAEIAAKPDEEQRARALTMLKEKGYEISLDDATLTDSGLWYYDIEQGDGAQPAPTSTVTVHYTGWFPDGVVFDSSHDRGQPAQFPLNGVIKGWTEGVGSMNEGGKRLLIIPGTIAYGPKGRPPLIPGNATLVFEVELLEVQ